MDIYRSLISGYLNNVLYGWIRTTVPWIIGLATAWLATHNINIHVSYEALQAIFGAIALAVTTLYYWIVRLLARKWPSLEWLLGLPKPPVYAPVVVQPASAEDSVQRDPTKPDSEGA